MLRSILDIDYAAGSRRSAFARHSKFAARLRRGACRAGRLRMLRRAIGAKTVKVATAGVAPDMTYGAVVHGITDSQWQVLRRTVAASLRPAVTADVDD